MRKMAAFVFSLLIMLACAVQAGGETTADDAREAARRTATVWYLAATYGKSSSQELFSGWQPENFNFDGTLTNENGETVLRFAWMARMFFDTSFDYTPYESVEGDELIYRVPEEIMLETLERYVVCTNLETAILPFYDPASGLFVFAAFGGMGGMLEDTGWTVTAEAGGWRARFVCPDRYREDLSYPEIEDLTLGMTADYRVESLYLRVEPKTIEWKTRPSVLEYAPGDPLNISGAVIRAVHASGASWEVPVTAEMVSGYTPSQGGTQSIRVQYGGQTLTFTVTVKAPQPPTGNTTGSSAPTTEGTGTTTSPVVSDPPETTTPPGTLPPSTNDSRPSGVTDAPAQPESEVSAQTGPVKEEGPPWWVWLVIVAAVVVVGGITAFAVVKWKNRRRYIFRR